MRKLKQWSIASSTPVSDMVVVNVHWSVTTSARAVQYLAPHVAVKVLDKTTSHNPKHVGTNEPICHFREHPNTVREDAVNAAAALQW